MDSMLGSFSVSGFCCGLGFIFLRKFHIFEGVFFLIEFLVFNGFYAPLVSYPYVHLHIIFTQFCVFEVYLIDYCIGF